MGLYIRANRPVDRLHQPLLESVDPERPTKFSNPTTLVKGCRYSVSVVIVDSPNSTRSTNDVFGPAARPDWSAILQFGRRQGYLIQSIVAVNDGIPDHAVEKFRGMGYRVQFSHARDVDDRVVSQVVRMVDRANVFVIVSGDGGYCSLVKILRRLHKRVIVVAVERCCHRILRRLADEFHPLPVNVKGVSEVALFCEVGGEAHKTVLDGGLQ